jgi:hypothetical protein
MGLNIGYLKSQKIDEAYTPYYAVEPIIKYIPKDKVIWCPFDEEWSTFVQSLKANGNIVIATHINNGYDFFNYEPYYYDIIISNPPFSIKDIVLKRLYELGKPFMILLPLNSLQGKLRYNYFSNGIQLLAFDERIGFHNEDNMIIPVESTPFASAYFCKDILPKDLILEHLNKYNRAIPHIEMVKSIGLKEMVNKV